MRSLRDIRDGASHHKKQEKQLEPQRVEHTLTQKAKKLQQVAETKRKEITQLNRELQVNQEKARQSGDVLVKEAKDKARIIIAASTKARNDAMRLRDKLEEEKQAVATLALKVNKEHEANKAENKSLSARDKKLARLEKEIAKAEQIQTKAVADSQEVLHEIMGLLLAASRRMRSLELLDQTGKENLGVITETFDELLGAFSERKVKQDALEEHLEAREKQIEQKQAILKEQRIQFLMLKRDPIYGKRNILPNQ